METQEIAMDPITRFATTFALAVLLMAPPAFGAEGAMCRAPEARAAIDDGRIVEQQPCTVPFASYEAWMGFLRQRHAALGVAFDEGRFRADHPPAIFARLQEGGIECRAVTYRSDGLEVAGFVLQPKRGDKGPLPAIIFNRGGNRDFGRLVFSDLMEFAAWAQQGFLVLASQYRGTKGSEGLDEFGGADVHDVLNLFPVAASFGADMRNVFMAGTSRGGMMTYLALKSGAPVKAAAVIGGLADLVQVAEERPEMRELFRELIPDFDQRGPELMRTRSAVDFADQLNAPLLILHGGADARVPAGQALTLAQRLQQQGKSFELVLYADDNHGLERNQEDSQHRMLAWFKHHIGEAGKTDFTPSVAVGQSR
jgi:dipeptidyl aminopeptidase/acylaminoacyl peptidase